MTTSLREEIGDKDPALIFSFRGLDATDLESPQGEPGTTVFEDSAEMVSAMELRFAEEMRPR